MKEISKTTKINQLIMNWPRGSIKTVKELKELGYIPQLLKVYSNSKWIELYTRGMYKLYGDEVGWQGILHGLQRKSITTLHAGAKTALSLKGYGHYLNFRENKVYLFSDMKENFNVWLEKNPHLILKRTEVFDYYRPDYLTDYNTGIFKIKISSPELAALEMFYLIPQEQSFDEAEKIMEGLTTLRPQLVQSLLEECKSVKVKRLFLFMAEKLGHNWLKELQLENVNLGSGKRVIVKNGMLNKKHNITVPREGPK